LILNSNAEESLFFAAHWLMTTVEFQTALYDTQCKYHSGRDNNGGCRERQWLHHRLLLTDGSALQAL
jgi:hypothetical protein